MNMLLNVSNHTTVFELQEGLYAITYKRSCRCTREEMMKLWMYDAVADVQEKNDKEQVAEGSCKAQVCSYKGSCS